MGYFVQTAGGHMSEWHPTLDSAYRYAEYLRMLCIHYILIDCRTNDPIQ